MNNILLINDMAGYGKVALSAMIPIMSNMKFQVYNLPTALVSNTLDYGKFDILETTGYMKNSMRVWGELGFTFDTIATGFLVSEEQTRLVAEFCEKKKDQGAFIFVDPIMGDPVQRCYGEYGWLYETDVQSGGSHSAKLHRSSISCQQIH